MTVKKGEFLCQLNDIDDQFYVGLKGMTDVCFTTKPCEPRAAPHKVEGKLKYCDICPVLTALCILGLKDLKLSCTFLLM